MAITLAEWAKSGNDPMERGVVKSWLMHYPFLAEFTVDGIDGFETEWLVEQQLPSVGWRSLNEAFVESTGKVERRKAGIGLLGSLIDIDLRLLRAPNKIDQAAQQMSMTTRSMGYTLANTIVNGSLASDPETFDGLLRQVTELNTRNSRQVINASGLDLTTFATRAANAQALVYYVNQAITRVESYCGKKPKMMLMSENMKSALTDSLGSGGYFKTTTDAFDREVDTWNGVQIRNAGWTSPTSAGGTEIITDTFDGDGYTSIFFVCTGPDYTSLIQQGGLEKTHIGPTENGVWDRWKVEHGVGMRVKDNGSVVRIQGLDITA